MKNLKIIGVQEVADNKYIDSQVDFTSSYLGSYMGTQLKVSIGDEQCYIDKEDVKKLKIFLIENF